jgi:hypothetical protein
MGKITRCLDIANRVFLDAASDPDKELPEGLTRTLGRISLGCYWMAEILNGRGRWLVEDEIENWADRIRERDRRRHEELVAEYAELDRAAEHLQERRLSKLEQHRRHLARRANRRGQTALAAA